MSASTDSRLLSLVTNILKLVQEGNRDGEQVCNVLQVIKDSKDFTIRLLSKTMSVWKTLTVGGATKDELIANLSEAGREVSTWAKDIMGKAAFVTSPKAHDVSFVRSTVRDLGFTKDPTTTELIARVKELGELCQPEDGPWLALLQDLERGDWFWLIMEPIADSGGDPSVFYVGRDGDGDRWLGAGCVGPDGRWGLDARVVFRTCK